MRTTSLAILIFIILIFLPGTINSEPSAPAAFSWKPLGLGMNDMVVDLTVYQGNLIAGGNFTTAGGDPAYFIAKWDGSNWDHLLLGTNGSVTALALYKGKLIVAGFFSSAGGTPVSNIASWDPDYSYAG